MDTYQVIFFDSDRSRAERIRDYFLNLGWNESYLDIRILENPDALNLDKKFTKQAHLFIFSDEDLFIEHQDLFETYMRSIKLLNTLSHFKINFSKLPDNIKEFKLTKVLNQYQEGDIVRVLKRLKFRVHEQAGQRYVKIFVVVSLLVAIITYYLAMTNTTYAAIFFLSIMAYMIGQRLYKIYLFNFTKKDEIYCRCI